MPSRPSNAVLTVDSSEARDIGDSLGGRIWVALSEFGRGESRLPPSSSRTSEARSGIHNHECKLLCKAGAPACHNREGLGLWAGTTGESYAAPSPCKNPVKSSVT